MKVLNIFTSEWNFLFPKQNFSPINWWNILKLADFINVIVIWVIPQESGNFRGKFETYFIYLRLNFFDKIDEK